MARQTAVQPAEPGPLSDDAPSPRPRRHIRWAAYLWGAVVLVSLVVTIPLAMGSIFRQLFQPPTKTVYLLSPGVADRVARPANAATFTLVIRSPSGRAESAQLRFRQNHE